MKLLPTLASLLLTIALHSTSPCSLLGQKLVTRTIVDQDTIRLNEPLKVTYMVYGMEEDDPYFERFVMLHARAVTASWPSVGRSEQSGIIEQGEGKGQRYWSETLLLYPPAVGNQIIDGNDVGLLYNGEWLDFDSVKVVVLDPSTDLDDVSMQDCFMEFAYDKRRKYYVGGLIPFHLRLYTALNVQEISTETSRYREYGAFVGDSEDIFRSSGVYEAKLGGDSVRHHIFHGRKYTSDVLCLYAIHPLKKGTFHVPTEEVRVIGRVPGKYYKNDYDDEYRLVRSIGTPITIHPLPLPAPSDFGGGVGTYSVQSPSDTLHTKTNRILRWTIDLVGDGRPELVDAPQIHLHPDSFELRIQDDNKRNYWYDLDSASQKYTRSYQVTVIPRHPGIYKICPTFTYFDHIAERYDTAYGGTRLLIVAADSSVTSTSLSANGDLSDLRPIYAGTTIRRKSLLWGTPLFWVCISLVPLVVVIVWQWQRYHRRPPTATQIHHQRIAEARRQLQEAQTTGETGRARDGYEAIARTLLAYLAKTCETPTHTLDNAALTALVGARYQDTTLGGDLAAILQDCRVVLYARSDAATALPTTFQRAHTWLDRAAHSLIVH